MLLKGVPEMTFPPGTMPIIPPPPNKGVLNWDVPLDAVLTSLTTTQQAAWQNAIDAAAAIGIRGITPVSSAPSEIANPHDGQVCYVLSTRNYLRYDLPTTTWVPFLTQGADGTFINSYRGPWAAGIYAAGSIVTNGGSSWLSTGATTAIQVPGTDPVWAIIASIGATGPTGAAGSNGQGVPVAGTTGQYLKKTGSGDYATGWGTVVDGDVSGLASVSSKATDSAVVHLTGAETIAGIKTFSAAPIVPSNSFPEAAITNLVTDLAAKLALAGGTLTGPIISQVSAGTILAHQFTVTGDTQNRFVERGDGQLMWGSGAAVTDVTLRRSAAGVLTNDNTGSTVGGIQVGAVAPAFGGGVGVLGVTNAATVPNANPTGGGVFYAASGAPVWRDPNGNVWALKPVADAAPEDQNLIAWSFEPQFGNGSNVALTAGVISLARVIVRSAATITNIQLNVAVAAVTNTNTWVGLYDFTGTQRGLSADQSTPFQTTGSKTVALTTPYAAAAGNYWVAVLVGAAGTLPQLSSATTSSIGAAFANIGLTAATARWATTGSGLTALPSTITPGNSTLSNNTLAVALS